MKQFIFLLCMFCSNVFAQYTYSQNPDYFTVDSSRGAVGAGCDNPENPFVNCGFEQGDLTGWVLNDLATPYFAGLVVDDGATVPDGPAFNFFTALATEGVKSFMTGFDGEGPGVIELSQDVDLPANIASMTFDYRAAWDLSFGATIDRTFSVEIQPAGGGAPLQSDLILTAVINTNNEDTGNLSPVVDLSAFAGQSVRVAFSWVVPEAFTGPAQVTIDNVNVNFVPPICETVINPINNCSFETGDTIGWTVEDLNTPLLPVQVVSNGFNNGFFDAEATDGSQSLAHGFDGSGPEVIRLWQEVTVVDGPRPMLSFDYRAAWDITFNTPTLDREFYLLVEPVGGGAALQSDLIFTAMAGTSNSDTGPLSAEVNLSAFTNQEVRLVFEWVIPEPFTGPGQFQLDTVDMVDGDLIFADGYDTVSILP